MKQPKPFESASYGQDNILRRSSPTGQIRRLQFEEQQHKRVPVAAHLGMTAERFGKTSAYFVPVSFVARDWKVSPRRIRALLHEGRLQGRVMDNGYWEVQYPYLYTFGTRGPSLKRQQRAPKRPKASKIDSVTVTEKLESLAV